MREQGSGVSVVNVLSTNAFRQSGVVLFAYSASMAALWSATRTVSCEVAQEGIRRVNAVASSAIEPDNNRKRRSRMVPEASHAMVESMAPMRRQVLGSEVANTIAFLLSPDASGITSVVIPVDRGVTAQ